MNAGRYIEPKLDYTQDLIRSMIESVIHLYFKPLPTQDGVPPKDRYRVRHNGLVHTYDGNSAAIYPNGIDYGIADDGYQLQIKWDTRDDYSVVNLTPIEDVETRTNLGRVLRHLLDTTE